jgi:hypothetical protein
MTITVADVVKALEEAQRIDDLAQPFEVVDEGEWSQDHKYQTNVTIIRHGDQFFCIQQSRSGSYHTDWYYGDTEVSEVERKEETKVVVTWPSITPTQTAKTSR